MKISYDKLWKLMKKNKMKKSELAAAAEISGYTMTKLYRDEPGSPVPVNPTICGQNGVYFTCFVPENRIQ